MLSTLVYRIDPIGGFKIYNAIVVLAVCFIIGWRTQRLSALWLLFPLLVVADSGVPWLKEPLYWCVLSPYMATRRALFTSDLVCNILVSGIVSASCIVLYRKWSTSSS